MNLDNKKIRQRFQKILYNAAEDGKEYSCQFAVYRHGKFIVNLVAGYIDSTLTEKVNEDILFPFFSVVMNNL
jgi:CubicO group peptidase (beta-lactamase class C family)